MRVRWRLIFNPISRRPVRMKLTGERYTIAGPEKDISVNSNHECTRMHTNKKAKRDLPANNANQRQ
ncbi:MAG: hypothetical protein DMF39_08395 [Verrucomicrobia bacterium]|nr:MAG: hypothetical protein DMF39_08395 [Verrucomicrobiota bacterium]